MRENTTTNMVGYFSKFSTDDACRKYLVEKYWKNGPICPYCKNTENIYVYKSRHLHKCSKCKQQFTITTGTIFGGSRLPLRKLFHAHYLISISKGGISSAQLGRLLGISQKSAWNLAHKIRESLRIHHKPDKLSKIVEVDETYVGGKKKGIQYRGRSTKHKTPVFGMLQRNGDLIILPVPDTKRKTLEPIILRNIEKGSHIMSDEWWAYNKLDKNYKHSTVLHKAREYVRGNVHTNGIEGAWAHLKRALRGTYIRPSRKHLDKYCAEFQLKYNTRNDPDFVRFEKAIDLSRRITQKQIT